MPTARLILASASRTRQDLLRQAGLSFTAIPAAIDEDAVKIRMAGTPRDLAASLAAMKSQAISRQNPGALVIGADQVLLCAGAVFSKPQNLAEAALHLQRLSGSSHELITAISVHRDGKELWRHLAAPKLTMRPLSERFIRDYLAMEGQAVCSSVGAYRLEGLGIQLFEAIEGDFFTILGLALLPLLAFLRRQGAVPA